MSERVDAVVDAMCQNRGEISEVLLSGNEYYFRYRGHTMSVIRRESSPVGFSPYSLYVYPTWRNDIGGLAALLEHSGPDEAGIKMATYHGQDCDEDGLRRLYKVLEEIDLNIDAIFDSILVDHPNTEGE